MSEENKDVFALSKQNYQLIIAGVIAIAIGFLLMAGGKETDPNQFTYDEIFSPMRITVAPLVILLGLGVVLFGIMKKPKEE